MCCRTNSFCCTKDMRKGLMIAGIIDIIICLILIIFNAVVARFFLPIWLVVVIIADIFLIVGAWLPFAVLLMDWLIVGMMNIVFLFILWPVYALIYISLAEYTCVHNAHTGEDLGFCINDTEVAAWFWFNTVFIIGLPIYYIYIWVVVKSLRGPELQPK